MLRFREVEARRSFDFSSKFLVLLHQWLRLRRWKGFSALSLMSLRSASLRIESVWMPLTLHKRLFASASD
jgi:hypothetical protein